jgi:hypothetical protein
VWRASSGAIHCLFDQIPNLQNCFTTPNKNLGEEGPQTPQTPAAKSLYRSAFQKKRPLGFGVFICIWSMGADMRRSRCDERICRVQGELMFCGGSLSIKDLGEIG